MRRMRLTQANVLAKLAPYYKELFRICTNGVLPNLKLVQCLQKMHLTSSILTTTEPPSTWASNIGGLIRMIAAKFRGLTDSPEKLARCFGKVCWSLPMCLSK